MTAVALLALLHIYIGARLLAPLHAVGVVVGAFALAALFALVLAGASPILRRRATPAALTWAGLIAMGFFSSLLVLTALRDVLLLATSALRMAGVPAAIPGTEAIGAMAVLALALLATVVGFANARRRPAVRHVDLPVRGLPPSFHGYSIVQISDLHVGPTIRVGFVRRVVAAVNALAPDAIAITGDIVDGRVAELREHTASLGDLRARDGVFAVTGNHEYYSGAAPWVQEFKRLGIRMLMNEHAVVHRGGDCIVLAGVTDFSAHHFDPEQRSDPQMAVRQAPTNAAARVLLAHQPRTAAAAEQAGFDIQLSGHTHGGQFLPWNLFVPLQQPYTAGLHRRGSLLIYVSRGTGYWGPPKRLGAPSEITLLRLVPSA